MKRKHEAYYRRDRSDFLDWVVPGGGRILEVGCGAGENAERLRGAGDAYLVGVEPDSSAASAAEDRFDEVLAGPIEEVARKLTGPFDLIICADVLEHTVDPWGVLSLLRVLSHSDTRLVASIPNIRHYRALARIAFGAGFHYEAEGIFDSTHLRFFVRENIDTMLRACGWSPEHWKAFHSGRIARGLSWLSGGLLDDWLAYQWYVTAHLAGDSGS